MNDSSHKHCTEHLSMVEMMKATKDAAKLKWIALGFIVTFVVAMFTASITIVERSRTELMTSMSSMQDQMQQMEIQLTRVQVLLQQHMGGDQKTAVNTNGL